jgi:hypothetical protein
MEVESYFRYFKLEFSNEEDRISWIKGILKNKALRWHQARVKALRSQKLVDNWEAYWAAADGQFHNKYETTENARKIRELKYKGHISDYLVKLRDLNCQVGSVGPVVRDKVKSQMPSDIIDMMYSIGPLPMDDNEFLRVLEIAGKRIEEKRRDHENGDSKTHKQHSEDKNKKDKKTEKRDKKNKNGKGFKNTDKNKIYKKDDRKKKDFKFATVKAALEGMTEDMIKKHIDVKANCWGCGREGHYTPECYAKKIGGGEDIVTAAVSSAQKRRREDNKSSNSEKKAKVSAMKETTAEEERRIWEVDSENEEDF